MERLALNGLTLDDVPGLANVVCSHDLLIVCYFNQLDMMLDSIKLVFFVLSVSSLTLDVFLMLIVRLNNYIYNAIYWSNNQ